MTDIDIQPLRDDRFGGRVRGVTADNVDDPAVQATLNSAFEERGLLVFEDVDPTPQMQVAISNVFGPLKDHPSKATPRVEGDGMLGVIEIRHDPEEGGIVEYQGRRLSQWLPWHFDHCYNDELNRAGVLRSPEIPPEGGRTRFVDGIALYEAVPAEIREQIEGETIRYAMDVILDNLHYGRPDGFEEIRASSSSQAVMDEYADRPLALHPAVWTRESGEKVLHLSPWMAKGIHGRQDADGEALLHAAAEAVVEAAERLCYEHPWAPTDMVIWDNWRVLHAVTGMDPSFPRCMHRTTIKGDYGLGRFDSTPA